jgi:hypothetical protein
VWPGVLALAFVALLLLSLSGCQKTFRVSDPQLRPIQQMLDEQLPMGSTTGRVNSFLATRGYSIETPEKPGTIVAVIRHIDTERVEPVTARVTFHFDAHGKLNNTEIVRTANQPIQP